MKTLFITSVLFLMGLSLSAQATYQTNNPFANPSPLGYLGWNDLQNTLLDIKQNNTIRMRFTKLTWNGYNGSSSTTNASRVFMGINGNTMVDPFSILHLGYNINYYLRRAWMNVGTTYGAGNDFMHTGLLVHPAGAFNDQTVDAVVVWGDNDEFFEETNGPDNLRFLFMSPTNVVSNPAAGQEGHETLRITPKGNIGIGDFSYMPNGIGATYGQPRARLDVQLRNKLRSNTENTAAIFMNDAYENSGYVQLKRGIVCAIDNSENEAIDMGIAGVSSHIRQKLILQFKR